MSPRSVHTAAKLLDTAVPEIVALVQSGQEKLFAASEVAKHPKPEQARIVNLVRDGKAKNLMDGLAQRAKANAIKRGDKPLPGRVYRPLPLSGEAGSSAA